MEGMEGKVVSKAGRNRLSSFTGCVDCRLALVCVKGFTVGGRTEPPAFIASEMNA